MCKFEKGFFVQKSVLETSVEKNPPSFCPGSWSTTAFPHTHPGARRADPQAVFHYPSPFWCFCPLLNLFPQDTTIVAEGLSCVWLQNLPEPSGTFQSRLCHAGLLTELPQPCSSTCARPCCSSK